MNFIKGYRRWLSVAAGFGVMFVNNVDVGFSGNDVQSMATSAGAAITSLLSIWSIFSPEPAKKIGGSKSDDKPDDDKWRGMKRRYRSKSDDQPDDKPGTKTNLEM